MTRLWENPAVTVAALRAQGLAPVQASKWHAWIIREANVPWVRGPIIYPDNGSVDPNGLWVPCAVAVIIKAAYCVCERVRLLQQGPAQWAASATAIVLAPQHVSSCGVRHDALFQKLPRAREMLGF